MLNKEPKWVKHLFSSQGLPLNTALLNYKKSEYCHRGLILMHEWSWVSSHIHAHTNAQSFLFCTLWQSVLPSWKSVSLFLQALLHYSASAITKHTHGWLWGRARKAATERQIEWDSETEIDWKQIHWTALFLTTCHNWLLSYNRNQVNTSHSPIYCMTALYHHYKLLNLCLFT